MPEYTPTTEAVRSYYVEGRLSIHDGGEDTDEAQFDRWLADTIREAKAEAWDEGKAAPADGWFWQNDYPRKGLRTRIVVPTANPYRTEQKGAKG